METKGDRAARHKALSFQQPWATLIMLGQKTVECRTRNVHTPIENLVVCASKTASQFYPFPGLAYGYAIALVDVADCVPFERKHLKAACMDGMPNTGANAWILENARPIVPFEVHASASFFYVEHALQLADISSFKDYWNLYQPIGFSGKTPNDESPESIISSMLAGEFI